MNRSIIVGAALLVAAPASAAGTYDDLVGLYGGQPQGAVGLSFGAERLIVLLEERKKNETKQPNQE